MISRLAAPRRTGRKYLTAIAVAGLVVGVVLAVGSALAVNSTGAFELDGNAITAHGAGRPDDADRVCYDQAIKDGLSAADATAKCTATSGTTNSTASSWVDSTADLKIYTGGGSKDPQDPGTSWLWKAADTVPDKDTIDHAFAVRYSLTPDVATCPSTDPTCEVIFFGVDRFDNSGDAQLGFWFFKSTIGLTNTAQSGGFKFSGHHQNGDLLVISDFSVGGTTSTIAAYFWDNKCGTDNTTANKIYSSPSAGQCGANNLRLQAVSTAANCAQTGPTAPFCGIANASDGTPAPWAFTDKSGNHTYLKGEYYEAGINLSALNIGNECFASFVGESRASTSPTATLKDFVLGNFGSCSATAVTTPSASSAVAPGTPVTDHFVVSGSGVGSPPFPSSDETKGGHNVVFSYCGPITAPATCDPATATAIPPSEELSPTATQGASEATSAAINTSGSPLLPGRYCFIGSWAGDTNYPDGASDSSTRECFTVQQIPTTTVTTPVDGSNVPITGIVTLGSTVFDNAVVTGTSAGGNPPGNVSFWVCDPSQVTGATGSEVCAAGAGTAVSGNPKALSADSGSNPPTSSATSGGVTMATAGVWCFRATYTPSGTVYLGSSDAGSHSECVTVGKINTSTVTTPRDGSGTAITSPIALGSSVYDYARVTAAATGDGTPTGTVDFYVCDPSQVTGTGASAHCAAGTQVGSSVTVGAVSGSSPPASEATSSPAVTANKLGVWCFRAIYTPGGSNGGNYNGSSDSGNGECFTVATTSSATSAQTWLPNDSVTVSTVGSVPLDGTLDITLRSGSCTGTVLYTEPQITLSNTTSGTSFPTTNTSVRVTVASAASYYWRAVFTSSNPFVGSYTKCELTTMTINNNP